MRVGVLFGGESAEHEVSLQSAKNVVDAIDPERYEVVLIGIDRKGAWHLADAARFLASASDPRRIELRTAATDLALAPGKSADLVEREAGSALPPLDVVFPVLHGPMGEDGTVQGLLRLAHLPFVGPGVLGSAVGMDKDVAKRLLRDAGIAVAPFITVGRRDGAPAWSVASAELGSPVFVKPANMGSSVGVSKAANELEYEAALDGAFSFDSKVLLERSVTGREIECSVLGNEAPEASLPGEVAPRHDFYSYEAKYLDDVGADLMVPADLDEATARRVRELSVRVFQTLCCEGMARVDFFLTTVADEAFDEGELVVNEINTIPGFTRISMYPKLWEATGLSYPDLIDRLISLALERAGREARLASAIDLESADVAAGEGA
ncbi:MAG: D-alanine--D-alanine ligase [Gemmatimonadetes bacterium]|nr:D-alanine--D-alanine ligase [Gemmatimonadota bacterium]